jgi:hypothetical protein|tara:strand:+ start:2255 stop:2611 length:357 start_codon:yes stop_codon:yes gene_type:complete
MANVYVNGFYTPTQAGLPETVFTCPDETTTIFQTLQLVNVSGSKNVSVYIEDFSTSALNRIAYVEFDGPLITNVFKGSIVLEEKDVLKIETSDPSGISGTTAALETTRIYIPQGAGAS